MVRQIVVVGCLVAVLVVVGAVLVSRSGAQPTGETPSPPGPAPERTLDPGSCDALSTVAEIRTGDQASPVDLTAATFDLDLSASPPTIRSAGRLEGTVPEGERLWVVDNPRPDSADSTPEHNPGNDRFYPVAEIETVDGCWVLPANGMGYDEAVGIDFDIVVVLVDDTAADDFRRHLSSASGDGYTRDEFELRQGTVIATFTVAT